MPHFQGSKIIEVQPRSDKVPYRFEFTVCSALGVNDGALPFGSTISSYSIVAIKHDTSGTVATDDLIDSHSRSGFYVTANLQYPATNGTGRYKLRFVLTLASGAIMEFDFGRVICVDR